MKKKHILLDANVAAAYYAPKSTHSRHLRVRSKTLLESAPGDNSVVFMIPNFCIAEVFTVFEKYRWGKTWNRQVNPGSSLTPKEFSQSRQDFHLAIHNATRIHQVELNRYHILCVDLISPINAAYQIKRQRGVKRNITPAKTYDLLYVAMGIWLQKIFDRDNFVMVTGDERIALIVDRAKSAALGKPIRSHLKETSTRLGLEHSAEIYPTVIDLVHARKAELVGVFPEWGTNW